MHTSRACHPQHEGEMDFNGIGLDRTPIIDDSWEN
jgi:hypothetical protein